MKIIDFLSRHKKIILICLTLSCIFSVITLFNSKADVTSQKAGQINKETFEASPFYGYDVKINDNGEKEYSPNNSDPQIILTLHETSSFDQVVVRFKNELPMNSTFQLYYAREGEPLSEQNSVKGILLEDRQSVMFFVPEDAYSVLRADLNVMFSFDSIQLINMNLLGVKKVVSIPAVITLVICAILMVLLAVFEKELGYYSYVVRLFKKLFYKTKELFKNKKYIHLFIRILLFISVLTLVFSYIILTLNTQFTHKASVYLFVLSLVTIIFAILDFVLNHEHCNIAVLAMLIALSAGILQSFSLPKGSNASWDDQIHYSRTVDLKCMLFQNEQTCADDAIINILYPYDGISEEMSNEISLLSLDEIKVASERRIQNIYSSIAYLPGAFGMALGEAFNADFIKTFFFTKAMQVVTYAIVLYFALKRLKNGALILASVCLLPTAIYLTASFSYDWWVIVFIALGYSIFISEMQQPEKQLTFKTTLLMLGAMVLGCGPKAIYFFLIVPMLFMSKNKFKEKSDQKKYRVIVLFSIIIVLSTFLIPFFINTGSQTDFRGGSDVNSSEQLKFILTNPFTYAGILIKFLLDYISLGFASLNTTYYAYIGYSSNIFGTVAIFTMLYCAFTDKSEADDFENSLTVKMSSWLTVAIQLALVATALYISFTPVASTTINGCAYRYIFPVLIPALYALGSGKITNRMNKKTNAAIVFSLLAFNLFFSFFNVYIQHLM